MDPAACETIHAVARGVDHGAAAWVCAGFMRADTERLIGLVEQTSMRAKW